VLGARIRRLLKLQNSIIILSGSIHSPNYSHRFKKWYPKQKAQHENQCKGFELLLRCINENAQVFVDLDLLDNKYGR